MSRATRPLTRIWAVFGVLAVAFSAGRLADGVKAERELVVRGDIDLPAIWPASLDSAHIKDTAQRPTSRVDLDSPSSFPQTGILTPIDILSTSPSHSTFLRLLQLAKLVPVLNYRAHREPGREDGRGYTVFAPTNEAWEEWFERKGLDVEIACSRFAAWHEEDDGQRQLGPSGELADNTHFKLRQQLLYHILNNTLPLPPRPIPLSTPLSTKQLLTITTHETLLFPHRSPLPPTSGSPPVGSPWLPMGGDGDLGGRGQMLRVVFRVPQGDAEVTSDVPDSNRVDVSRSRADEIEVLHVGVGPDWLPQDDPTSADRSTGSSVWTHWPKRNASNPVPGTGGGNGNEPEPVPEPKPDNKMQQLFSSVREGASVTGKSIQVASNGYVIGLNRVLELPPDLASLIREEPSLAYLNALQHPADLSTLGALDHVSFQASRGTPDLATDPHLTIFAPTTSAFLNRFDKLERTYLEGAWGREGVDRILAGLILDDAADSAGIREEQRKSVNGAVGWRSLWAKKDSSGAGNVTTIGGDKLAITLSATGEMSVNDRAVISSDHFASNGVLHILDSIVLPPDFTLLNSAEKMLLTLNATRFVGLMRATNLSDAYTGAGAGSWTILAPTDEVLERMSRWRYDEPWARAGADAALAFDPELKALMQYHVLPGRLLPEDLSEDTLLETELRTAQLDGERQRLLVQVESAHIEMPRDHIGSRTIRFGDATVLAEPTTVGDSIIYLLSDVLDPPNDVIQTAVSEIKLSTYVASIFASGLDKYVKRTPGMTYFAPTNDAFAALGLTMRWLLSAEQGAKDDLRKIMRYHAVEGMIYESAIGEGNLTLQTVGGEPICLGKAPCMEKRCRSTGNRSISLGSPSRNDILTGRPTPINGEPGPAHIVQRDILTDTGVLHIIDSVEIPPNLQITIGKLMEGGKAGIMMDLLARAGMDWILDGSEAPDAMQSVSQSKDKGHGKAWALLPAYTVLVPRDTAWSAINISWYMEDPEALKALLNLHIIPTPPGPLKEFLTDTKQTIAAQSRPLALVNSRVFPTLHSAQSKYGDLVVSEEAKGRGWLIGLNGAYGGDAKRNFARMLESGKASPVWKPTNISTESEDETAGSEKKVLPPAGADRPIMSLGGGIIMIDTVLEPFEPSWLAEHGWYLAGSLFAASLLIAIAAMVGRWWWRRRQGRIQLKMEDEPLEGEEEF